MKIGYMKLFLWFFIINLRLLLSRQSLTQITTNLMFFNKFLQIFVQITMKKLVVIMMLTNTTKQIVFQSPNTIYP